MSGTSSAASATLVLGADPEQLVGRCVVLRGVLALEQLGVDPQRQPFLTAATLAGHLTVFVVLAVSLRAVGVMHTEVTIVEAFAAWTLARILGAIPTTPGGVGFVELGLTGVLVAFGASSAEAVARLSAWRLSTTLHVDRTQGAGQAAIDKQPGQEVIAGPSASTTRPRAQPRQACRCYLFSD